MRRYRSERQPLFHDQEMSGNDQEMVRKWSGNGHDMVQDGEEMVQDGHISTLCNMMQIRATHAIMTERTHVHRSPGFHLT